MRVRLLALPLLVSACAAPAQVTFRARAPYEPHAEAARTRSLAEAKDHADHHWRDRAPLTDTGALRGYVEIGQGDADKREFSMKANGLVVDRVIDAKLGGYPTNYGFVPQTIAFDGDPLDVLVLGPRLEPGSWAEGKILGILHMTDEKGEDPKIVISAVDEDGQPLFELSRADKTRIATWFAEYKALDEDKRSEVTGWGDAEDARRTLDITRAYFDHGPAGVAE